MISLSTAMMVGALCVVVEAFFSGSEIALVSSNRSRLLHRAQQGDRGAVLAQRFLNKPEIFLATTLIGTNLATVTFSVTVSLALISGGDVSGLWAIALVTPITLIFGEAVPKVLFQQHADRIVTKVVYPLHVASLLLRPGVWVMSSFARIITRLWGVGRERAFMTRAELALLIEAEEATSSEISVQKREMIGNVLELSETTVEEVMIPLSEMTALPEDSTLQEAAVETARNPHSRMPVYRSRVDNIVGILHVFDLLHASTTGQNRPIASIAEPPRFVPESKLAADLLVELQRSGDSMVVVVDEYGGTVGIVTVEDLVEEIVGEIDDEFDVQPTPRRMDRMGLWRVEARISVERINHKLGLNLPESDNYESVAGLIVERLKCVPEPGVSLQFGDVTMEVVAATERAIETVQIHASVASGTDTGTNRLGQFGSARRARR